MPKQEPRRSDADRPVVAADRTNQSAAVTDDAVRNRAYEIYERRGAESGHDQDDWLEAEIELRTERNRK